MPEGVSPGKKMSYPEAIYLDTNMLITLKKDLNTPEYQELRDICNNLKIPILVPKLVLDELISFYLNEQLEKNYQKLDSLINKLSYYATSEQDINVKINKDKISKDLAKHITTQIKKVGIKIIPTPQIELETLINRAVNKIRPFREKDKGFRDTIILYTILNYAKDHSKGNHLFVTNDGDFEHDDVSKTASDLKVKLIIFKSIQEAKEYLQKFLKDTYQTYLLLRSKNLEKFLISQLDTIASFIKKEGTFSEMFFHDKLIKEPFVQKGLKRINGIEPIEIINVNMGFLPKDQEKGWTEISFMINLKFFITVEIQKFPWPPRLAIGMDKDVEMAKFSFLPKESELKEEEITSYAFVSAEVLVDQNLNFYDLKFTIPPGY